MRQMDPDLVRSPGLELGVQQTVAWKIENEPKHRMRLLAVVIHNHPAFSRGGYVLTQRRLDIALCILPFPKHKCQVMFAHGAFAQLSMQSGKCGALLR